MMELNTFLPILLYILGITLMIVLIILGIKIIQMMDKMERIMDNIEDKINSLNGVFAVINRTTNSIDLISSKVIGTVTNTIGRIFRRKKKEDTYYE